MDIYCVYDFMRTLPNEKFPTRTLFFNEYKKYRQNCPPRFAADVPQIFEIMRARLQSGADFLPSEDETLNFVVPPGPWVPNLKTTTRANDTEQETLKTEFYTSHALLKPGNASILIRGNKTNEIITKVRQGMRMNAKLRIFRRGWINIQLSDYKNELSAMNMSWILKCYKAGPQLYNNVSEEQFRVYFPGFIREIEYPVASTVEFSINFSPLDSDPPGIALETRVAARNVPHFINNIYDNLFEVYKVTKNIDVFTEHMMSDVRRGYSIMPIGPVTAYDEYNYASLATLLGTKTSFCIRGRKGTGKSRLTKMLSEAGVYVIDSDDYGRVCSNPDTAFETLRTIVLARVDGTIVPEPPSKFEEFAYSVITAVPDKNKFGDRCRQFSALVNKHAANGEILSIEQFTKLVHKLLSELDYTRSKVWPKVIWFAHTVTELHGITGDRIIEITPVLDSKRVIIKRNRDPIMTEAELFLHDFYANSQAGMVSRYGISVFWRVMHDRITAVTE